MSAQEHKPTNYFIVFYILVLMTGLTVGVSYVTMPKILGVAIALIVASFKASLVAWYFMHLKDEVKSIYVAAIVPVGLTIIMLLFLLPDFAISR